MVSQDQDVIPMSDVEDAVLPGELQEDTLCKRALDDDVMCASSHLESGGYLWKGGAELTGGVHIVTMMVALSNGVAIHKCKHYTMPGL
jgi:hypothetical protein